MKLLRTKAINSILKAREKGELDDARLGNEWIDHDLLIELGQEFNTPLRVLLQGTDVYFEPPVPETKSQTYLDLMARLRLEQQEREYQELLGNRAQPTQIKPDSIDAKQIKEEITTIFNILISVAAVAWAMWHWTVYMPVQVRTLASLFGAILILVAEVVVYMGYRRRVAEARNLEQKKVEKKVINSTWTAGADPEILGLNAEDAVQIERITVNSLSTSVEQQKQKIKRR